MMPLPSAAPSSLSQSPCTKNGWPCKDCSNAIEPDEPVFSTPDETAFGRFIDKRKGAASAPRTEKGVFGCGYQNESGKNCVPIGLIDISPELLSTGRL